MHGECVDLVGDEVEGVGSAKVEEGKKGAFGVAAAWAMSIRCMCSCKVGKQESQTYLPSGL